MRSDWASLPEELVRRVAARLPVDARLSAAATCSSWREALRCTGAWAAALDLSPGSGVTVSVSEALLRAASRRARGALRALDLSRRVLDQQLPLRAVRAVLWANAGALARVRLEGAHWLSVRDVQALLRAGGEQLTALHGDVDVWLADPHYTQTVLALVAAGRLVLHGLRLRGSAGLPGVEDATALLLALAAARLDACAPPAELSSWPPVRVQLKDLDLQRHATPGQRAALLAALQSLSGRVHEFGAQGCGLDSDALRAVTAAATGQLRTLCLQDEPALLEGAGLEALGALLAASGRVLARVTLCGVCAEGVSAAGLVRTVCGGAALPALAELRLGGNGLHPDHAGDDASEGSGADDDDDDADADDPYDDDSSSEEAAAADALPPAPAAPPAAAEDGCGEACVALLKRSRALALLTLPWLLAASLGPMLPELQRSRALARLELQVRDCSDAWLRLRLLPALEPRPLMVELEASGSFHMHGCSAAAQFWALRDRAESAEYRRSRAMEKQKMTWEDWGGCALAADAQAPGLDAFRRPGEGYESDGGYDFTAYHKAVRAWEERCACALREPRSRQRPWQLGRRDFGALPARVIERIWSLLGLRERVACVGVCRAWRTGFAPADGFGKLRPPADVDSRLLQRLAPLHTSLHTFEAACCGEHELHFDDIEAFLWCTASRSTLTAELPALQHELWLNQVDALRGLSRHVALVADVTASTGAHLLTCLHGGLEPRRLSMEADVAAGWDTESTLACLDAFCKGWWRGCNSPGRSLRLSGLQVQWAPRRPGFDAAAVEDAARFASLERALLLLPRARLHEFWATSCRLTRRFVPAICALLRDELRMLVLRDQPRLLKRSARADQDSVALLAAAIRAAPQLRELMLSGLEFATQADVATLIGACTGHATLSELRIELTSKDGGHARDADAALVGAALAALVAAGAPALEVLYLQGDVSAAQVTPLAAALRRGGHSIRECRDVEEAHGSLLPDAVEAAR
jgi:hypothetical protein